MKGKVRYDGQNSESDVRYDRNRDDGYEMDRKIKIFFEGKLSVIIFVLIIF